MKMLSVSYDNDSEVEPDVIGEYDDTTICEYATYGMVDNAQCHVPRQPRHADQKKSDASAPSTIRAAVAYDTFIGKRPRVDELRVWGCNDLRFEPAFPKATDQAAKRRLLDVGATADRIGFRCFDPETFTFSTEFELTFDEQSGRKQTNVLREHDIRRELARR